MLTDMRLARHIYHVQQISPDWFGDSTFVRKENAFTVESPDGGRAIFQIAPIKDNMGDATGKMEVVLADWHAGAPRSGFGKSAVALMAAVAHEEGISHLRVWNPTAQAKEVLAHFCVAGVLSDNDDGFAIPSAIRKSAHRTFFEACDHKYAALVDKEPEAASKWLTSAAHLQGYSVGPVWHGSPHEFTAFNVDLAGQTDDGYYGTGVYFSPCRAAAGEYGRNIMTAFLRAKKPFFFHDSGTCGDIMKAREALAKLTFVDPHMKPDYVVPEGCQFYEHVQPEGSYGGAGLRYYVGPTPEHYDDPDVFYGRHYPTKSEAIVAFNDERKGVGYFDEGWATSLLKSVGRKNFTEALAKEGYDALVVLDEDDKPSEFLVWNPEAIKSANLVERDERGQIILPSKRFDKQSADIRGAIEARLAGRGTSDVAREVKLRVEL